MSDQQQINDDLQGSGRNKRDWDAAALLDGVYFDVQQHYDEQKALANKEGLVGVARMTNTMAVLSARQTARKEGGMNAVVAEFREMKLGERWNAIPTSVAHMRFFNKFTGKETEPLRKELTVDRIGIIRSEFQQRNPAQAGFLINRHEVIVLRFDDLWDVQDARSLAALLILAGFEFRLDRDPEKYVVFISGDGQRISKAIVTLRCTKRVMEVIDGSKPFLLNNYPVSVRVYTINVVQKGRVLKLEGSVCKWVKKMVTLGIPLQQVMWKTTECLKLYGFTVHMVYLDDEGFKKRFINVESTDFDIRVEFYSEESATIELQYLSTKLLSEKPTIYEGRVPQSSIIKSPFKLGTFQIRKIQATHPYCLVLNLGEYGQQLRQRVEETMGSSAEAATITYLENFFARRAPHLQLGFISPDTYGDDQVNFKKVRINYEKTDASYKAMLAVYACIASRSESYRENRLDFTVRDGDPFNDIRSEIWNGNQHLRKFKDCGERDDSDRKNDLDKRGFESDPINYFNQQWSRKVVMSPHEARVRRQTAEREAGMRQPIPMIGSSMERITEHDSEGEEAESENEDAVDPEGDALLMADPVHANFWVFEEPYTTPELRAEPQPNPFADNVEWHKTLFRVGPELILCEEWEHLRTDSDITSVVKLLLHIIAKWGEPFWAPAPGYNCLPMKPKTVPNPKPTMKNKDLRRIWDSPLWSSDPAVIYKALARLISQGWITQERFESGLRFEFGPRMRQDRVPANGAPTINQEHELCRVIPNLIFDLDNPMAYLWGDGNELNDDEAMLTARKLMALIDDRGAVCFPAGRYGDEIVSSIFVALRCLPEDNFRTYVRSHVEYEIGHLGCIIRYVLSSKRATQVVSQKAGGVYLLSEEEQERRVTAGISDADYEPIPWAQRPENRASASLAHAAMAISPTKPGLSSSEIEKVMGKGETKRRINLGTEVVASGHYECLQHQVLVQALNIEVPFETQQQLRHVASNLLPAIPQQQHIEQIAQDHTLTGQVSQDLARMALDSSVDPTTQLELAMISNDLDRMFMTRNRLKRIVTSQEINEDVRAAILRTGEMPSFFTKLQTKLMQLIEAGSLDEAGQLKLTEILGDQRLAQLADAKSKNPMADSAVTPAAGAQSMTAPVGWDQFRTEIQAQIDRIATLPDMPAEARYLLGNSRQDVGNTLPVSTEIRAILDGSRDSNTFYVRLASYASGLGNSTVGKQLSMIAIDIKKLQTCQEEVMEAVWIVQDVPNEAATMAWEMTSYATFYTAVGQRILALVPAAVGTEREQVMALLNDEYLIRRANGEHHMVTPPQSPIQSQQPSATEQFSLSSAASVSNEVVSMETTDSILPSMDVDPSNTDFLAAMRTQLAGIAATPGVAADAIASLERIGVELGQDYEIGTMMQTIMRDPEQSSSIQQQLAAYALSTTMEVLARVELGQIAADLHKAWKCHAQAVRATIHPSNPEAARILAGAIGTNPAFYLSIRNRLEKVEGHVMLTVEESRSLRTIAQDPTLSARIGGASSSEAEAKKKKSPSKPRRNKNDSPKAGGKVGKGGLERENKKTQVRVDPLARPGSVDGGGKK